MTPEGQHVVDGYHNQVRLDVVEHVPATNGALLDLGGGVGATAVYLKQTGKAARVGCFDRVPSSLVPPDLDFHCSGDLEDETFVVSSLASEGPFETVLCLDILEHLGDPWKMIGLLHDGLSPGGHIIASIPNVRHFRTSGALFLRNRWTLTDAGILDRTHLRFFVKSTAVELMTHTGLVLDFVVAPNRAHYRRLRALLSILTLRRIDSFLDVQYIVRVHKP